MAKMYNGACTHYVMVSKFQWKPCWLATQLYPQNDWTRWQSRVNYDIHEEAPLAPRHTATLSKQITITSRLVRCCHTQGNVNHWQRSIIILICIESDAVRWGSQGVGMYVAKLFLTWWDVDPDTRDPACTREVGRGKNEHEPPREDWHNAAHNSFEKRVNICCNLAL